ncbi:MAG: helix-hairpin-helix domain-containing protein [Halobacteriaceae archaeon]
MADADTDLTDLRFVGPATAAALRAAGISSADIEERRVDHESLKDAGVNPGVAARIRREHSLAWSHTAGGDLSHRAKSVGGLGDAERDWVAASSGDWENHDVDTERGEDWRSDESTWREESAPNPVTVLDEVSSEDATRLAEAGVTSVRTLAKADAERVARVLGLDPHRVRAWKGAARDFEE